MKVKKKLTWEIDEEAMKISSSGHGDIEVRAAHEKIFIGITHNDPTIPTCSLEAVSGTGPVPVHVIQYVLLGYPDTFVHGHIALVVLLVVTAHCMEKDRLHCWIDLDDRVYIIEVHPRAATKVPSATVNEATPHLELTLSGSKHRLRDLVASLVGVGRDQHVLVKVHQPDDLAPGPEDFDVVGMADAAKGMHA